MDQQHDCTLRSVTMKRIYGKFKGQRTFKAMDLRRGVQTNNLIFASLLTEEEATYFLQHTAPLNSDWQFEVRNAGTPEVRQGNSPGEFAPNVALTTFSTYREESKALAVCDPQAKTGDHG